MRQLAVIILAGAVYLAAQQSLPSAPSAGKVSPPPAQSQPKQTQAAPQQQQQQAPFNAGDVVPADSEAPPPVKKAQEPAKAATAQGNADDPDINEPEAKFVSRPTLVDVVFTVTDKHGRFIRDLTQESLPFTTRKSR